MRIFLATLILVLFATSAQAANTTFTIGWSAPSVLPDQSNAPAGYKVYRNSALATTVNSPSLLQVDIVVTDPPNTQECFTVSAFNAAGESAQSNPPVCGSVPLVIVVPGVPGNVVIIKMQ